MPTFAPVGPTVTPWVQNLQSFDQIVASEIKVGRIMVSTIANGVAIITTLQNYKNELCNTVISINMVDNSTNTKPMQNMIGPLTFMLKTA